MVHPDTDFVLNSDDVLRSLRLCRAGTVQRLLRGYQPVHPGQSEALLFLKPEVLGEHGAGPALDVVALAGRAFPISIGGVVALGPRALAGGLMQDHYSMLYEASSRGAVALSQEARRRVQLMQALSDGQVLPAMGAHQLVALGAATPGELLRLSLDRPTERIGCGAYATIGNAAIPWVVINAFHPFQLAQFQSPEAVVLAVQVCFERKWGDFRELFLGATDPRKADPGSLRGVLLRLSEESGRDLSVSVSLNAVHGSAGPLEGAVELARFFKIQVSSTSFGRLLSDRIGPSGLRWSSNNARVTGNASLFELTEHLDLPEALAVIQGAFRDAL